VPVFEIEISIKQDGAPLPRFPLIRRIQTVEGQTIATSKAGGDGAGIYVVVPGADAIPALQGFVLSSDSAVNLRLNGQSNGSVPLNAGGIMILIDGNLAAGATTNLTINNPGVAAANLTGAVLGT
jgi:hypothetical protein